jgi:hypothetical protein
MNGQSIILTAVPYQIIRSVRWMISDWLILAHADLV